MCATKRRFEAAVIARLFEQPQRFQFFQAVRMIEIWLKRNGVRHEGALANFLRFQNSVSLSFPASEIEALCLEQAELAAELPLDLPAQLSTQLPTHLPPALTAESGNVLPAELACAVPDELPPDGASLSAALRSSRFKYARMTPAFMGFLGSAGALPAHYTERIAAHLSQEKEAGPRAFLDMFLNRALILFYEAWRKYRLELACQASGKDRFLTLLLSLAGLGHAALEQRLATDGAGVHDESLAYFAAAIRQRPTSASSIARLLSEYFGANIALEQFIGCWYELPLAQQTALGAGNATLGASAIVGTRLWQRHLRMRLTIGPLDQDHFNAFLPGATAARSLEKLLTLLTGLSLEYEVCLLLRAQDVHGIRLQPERQSGHMDGHLSGHLSGRLGWDCFLITNDAALDRSDLRYDINTLLT